MSRHEGTHQALICPQQQVLIQNANTRLKRSEHISSPLQTLIPNDIRLRRSEHISSPLQILLSNDRISHEFIDESVRIAQNAKMLWQQSPVVCAKCESSLCQTRNGAM